MSKKVLSAITVCALLLGSVQFPATAVAADDVPIYQDKSYSFEERAADMVARMTTAQKGTQLTGTNSAAIPELGINSIDWWSEAIHGHSRHQGTNPMSYPVSYAAASSWNPDLYYREATEIGDEVRESAPGNNRQLTLYSPTVNLARDPRWGRNDENYGEDPYLAGIMGSAFTDGMEGKDRQGNLLDPGGYYKTITTAKHYTANNSERNRLNGGATADMRSYREYYTAPYRDMILNAGTQSIMTAYSTVNGTPVSMSSYFMDTLLRRTWGFDGYVTSDCDSVGTLTNYTLVNPYTGKNYTPVEYYTNALAHGEDLECSGGYSGSPAKYSNNFTTMISGSIMTDKGLFTENQADVSVHRLMTARMRLGEFDGGTAYVQSAQARLAGYQGLGLTGRQTAARLGIATDMGSESIVLLQNNDSERKDGSVGKLLPLAIPATGSYKVAIIGPHAQSTFLGGYSGNPGTTVNIQTGFTNAVRAINPDATVTYYKGFTDSGSNVNQMYTVDQSILGEIATADLCIVVAGTDGTTSAEDRDRTTIALPGSQAQLISAVGKANKNTVALLETCGTVQVNTFQNDVPAIVWSAFAGQNKGVAFANVLTGKVNPSGKTTALWHRQVNDTGESDLASIYDYTLYKTGTTPGRTYMYFDGPVSYPFGYGLSYTAFEYSNLRLSGAAADANDTVTATFDIKNVGSVAGKEVAQLYVAQPNAAPELLRPIKRLKGFDKVALAPGETKTVSISFKVPDLAFYDEAQDRYAVDTGLYEIQIGKSSTDIPLKGNITVSGSLNVTPKVLTAAPNQSGDAEQDIAERLIFNKGKTVNPHLTLAMNDESLYGYIIKGKSKPFPQGCEITYSSNRPSVVAVGSDGVIRTVNGGVATVTATLTYNGGSATTDFVVYVSSNPYPDGITVNGTPISGFNKDKTDYSICYPYDVTTVPTVGIIDSGNPDVVNVFTQAEGIPGVATIVATDTSNGSQVTYRIGFTRPPKTTEFKSADISIAKGVKIRQEAGSANPRFAIEAEKTITATLCVAAYDSMGRLVAVNTDTVTTEAGKTFYAEAPVPEDPEAATFRFFVWDSRFSPLTAVTDLHWKINGVGMEKFDKLFLGGSENSWAVQNAVPENVSVSADGLTVTTARGAYAAANKPENVFMQSAGGNWVAQTSVKLSNAPAASNQQAGFLVYGDDGNYIRFVYERPTVGTTNVIRVYQVINGVQTQRNTVNAPAGLSAVSLQINRQGDVYTFLYSTNGGTTWTTFGTTVTVTYVIPQLGLWAVNGDTTAASVAATFDRVGIYDIADVVPRLSSISVDGAPLASFNPEKFAYTIASASPQPQAPTVTAEASGGKLNVTVSQAESIPGTATVTVASEVARVSYNVYFNTYPTSDSFVAGTMDDAWKVWNEDKNQYSVDKGLGLRLPTLSGDIYGTNRSWYNVFTRPAAGDWDVVAKVYYPSAPSQNYQQIMLLAWQDEDNYLKLDCEGAARNVQFAREVNGSCSGSSSGVSADIDGSLTLYFKISKSGDTYTGAYSKDGITYTQVGSGYTQPYENLQIGVFATKNSNSATINAYCEYVTVTRLNGVDVKPYDAMLQDAFDNVAEYVFNDIPAATSDNIAFSRVPRGYSVTAVSSNPTALSDNGVVGNVSAPTTVNFTVTVMSGNLTDSKTIQVTVLPA
jgi:beta-glucosidase